MNDPLDALCRPSSPAAPDPEFRAQLMGILSDVLDGRPPATSPPSELVEVTLGVPRTGRSWKPEIALLASAAVIAALAIVVTRDTPTPSPAATNPSAVTLPPSTDPPTTTTVFVNPLSDAQIAEAVLLSAEEYAPGFTINGFPTMDVVLDRSVAESAPGCAAFLDTVFESDLRPAVVSHRWFLNTSRSANLSQYVAVLSSDTAAEAMFEATLDPTFNSDCYPQYVELLGVGSTPYCCDAEDPFAVPLAGLPIISSDKQGADDIAYRTNSGSWTDPDGTVHGPETFNTVMVRIGRIVTVIETITTDEFGRDYVDDAQFHAAIEAAVVRAKNALDGKTN